MRVVLEHVSGIAGGNLERAKVEMNRVLDFRGSVTGVKAKGTRMLVDFEINPQWDMTQAEKESYLKEWIPAKMKLVFRVVSVSS